MNVQEIFAFKLNYDIMLPDKHVSLVAVKILYHELS